LQRAGSAHQARSARPVERIAFSLQRVAKKSVSREVTKARQPLERNRSDTAIRCLEVALHLNTSDDEVIAGVNGYRRIVAGKPLSEVCLEFAGSGGAVAPSPRWGAQIEQLTRENLELRQRLAMTERAAEERLAELHSVHALAIDRLSHEIGALRRSLEETREGAAASPRRAPPFRAFLAAAQQAADDDIGSSPLPMQASASRNAPASRPPAIRGWTA
jgi:hypothetical protein